MTESDTAPNKQEVSLVACNLMKSCLLIIALFASKAMCQTEDSTISFGHVIQIPQQFAANENEAGWTTHERYRDGYESGWWQCIYDYQKNIDLCFDTVQTAVSGWPSETCGYSKGMEDANARIQSYIEKYGKARVHSELHKLAIPDTLGYKIIH
jgi:hypothetical protein